MRDPATPSSTAVEQVPVNIVLALVLLTPVERTQDKVPSPNATAKKVLVLGMV